jgi:hypothetical protein
VVDGWVTSPVRTVIDCCLDLPFDAALAVVDSSWRAGQSPLEVAEAAKCLPERSFRKVLRVLRLRLAVETRRRTATKRRQNAG